MIIPFHQALVCACARENDMYNRVGMQLAVAFTISGAKSDEKKMPFCNGNSGDSGSGGERWLLLENKRLLEKQHDRHQQSTLNQPTE